ncbi:MAG: GPW/gp25 family protein [Candidatus Dojkabacteria bacterium]|nr:GPW/gp25 family protein [Candidatus Dojkabacteria bacterium]
MITKEKKEFNYSDLPFVLKLNQHNDISLAENEKAINQSIINILYCSKNKRYLNPEFGCNILSFLFEEFSEETARKIGNEIKNKLHFYEPRIIIKVININLNENEKLYEIEIQYVIKKIQKISSITFSLQAL